MSGGVAKRYARALFEVAKERGLIDQIESELKDIVAAVDQNQELNKILTHKQITQASKKQLFSDLFRAHVAAETLSFLNVLIENGRETDLGSIADAYVAMANEVRGIADAIVTTAKPLNEEEQAQLAEQFGKQLNKTLRVKMVVDPAILGGVVVRIGDRLYDGSIKRKLEQFAHQL